MASADGGAEFAFSYDAELRLTKVTNPQGLHWSYEYDPPDASPPKRTSTAGHSPTPTTLRAG
ncbi:RHS repeat domain-containing protein [Streptomyces armeniacus]|uniref:RHS repeat domain-containing protein n=1 Tax=Streptomyces armeniacus TaxID=83291 RepID=UPI001FECA491|nr:RHS repeat domain-containing protein [Streptomyces armeniacus]